MDPSDDLELALSSSERKVKLTGYRLLNIVTIAGFGITKAVLSYRGYSIVPTTLDWLSGVFFAIGYVTSNQSTSTELNY